MYRNKKRSSVEFSGGFAGVFLWIYARLQPLWQENHRQTSIAWMNSPGRMAEYHDYMQQVTARTYPMYNYSFPIAVLY